MEINNLSLDENDIAYLIYNTTGTIEVVSPLAFIPEAEVKLKIVYNGDVINCGLLVDNKIWRRFEAKKIESINIKTLHKELILDTISDEDINYYIEYYGSLKMIRRLLNKCLD